MHVLIGGPQATGANKAQCTPRGRIAAIYHGTSRRLRPLSHRPQRRRVLNLWAPPAQGPHGITLARGIQPALARGCRQEQSHVRIDGQAMGLGDPAGVLTLMRIGPLPETGRERGVTGGSRTGYGRGCPV